MYDFKIEVGEASTTMEGARVVCLHTEDVKAGNERQDLQNVIKQIDEKIMATKKELKVATQDNDLYIETLQLPGKKKMPARDLLNGFTVAEGAQFV